MTWRTMRAGFGLWLAAAALLSCCTWPARCLANAPAGQVGADAYDLLLGFIGRTGGGDGSAPYRRIDRAMGTKSIQDAHDAGFTFLRVMATGFGPSAPNAPWQNDLARWQSDPSGYWADVDGMFDQLDRSGIQIVTTLMWNIAQFPALADETVTTFMTDPGSKSRSLAKRYITEFVSRYRARKTILIYEMCNECNLGEDLDLVQRCFRQYGNASTACSSIGNYTTSELLAFSKDMVALIKQLDPSRLVSSGFGTPRASAAHLAVRPEFSKQGADWRTDSALDFTRLMLETNAPFDIVSLHVYGGGENLRPALSVHNETGVAEFVAKVFHPLGKKVFVGEFSGANSSSLVPDMAQAVKEGDVDYAAVWAWEHYQNNNLQPFAPNGSDFRLEPGHDDQTLASLRSALAPPQSGPAEPRVVLTWPLPCSSVDQPLELSAVASLGTAAPPAVEFYVDGANVGTAHSVPYQVRFDPRPLGRRTVAVQARVSAPGNKVAQFTSNIILNGSSEACAVNP
jgi:hypothetical protein